MTNKKPVRNVRQYEIAPAGKKAELEGQALVVFETLRKVQPATMAQIAQTAAKKLETKQEPIRVINHYLGKLKAAKVVRIAAPTKRAA